MQTAMHPRSSFPRRSDLPLDPCPAREFLQGLGKRCPPAPVLAISPHWETAVPTVNRVAAKRDHPDYTVSRALYRLEYPRRITSLASAQSAVG